jgi:hypothetical protein
MQGRLVYPLLILFVLPLPLLLLLVRERRQRNRGNNNDNHHSNHHHHIDISNNINHLPRQKVTELRMWLLLPLVLRSFVLS